MKVDKVKKKKSVKISNKIKGVQLVGAFYSVIG